MKMLVGIILMEAGTELGTQQDPQVSSLGEWWRCCPG